MKNFTLVLVAALSITAAAGCKKKAGGDCATAVAKTMERHSPDMAKMFPADKLAEVTKMMSDAAMTSCSTDKWSADAISCYATAADIAAEKACETKVPEVKKSMGTGMKANEDKLMALMAPAADLAGSGAAPAAGSGAAPAAAGSGDDKDGDDKAAAAGPSGVQECDDYKAAMEKLASCDKFDATMKATFKTAYEATSASWANLKDLPAEARAALATGCKTSADAITTAGKAACGW